MEYASTLPNHELGKNVPVLGVRQLEGFLFGFWVCHTHACVDPNVEALATWASLSSLALFVFPSASLANFLCLLFSFPPFILFSCLSSLWT